MLFDGRDIDAARRRVRGARVGRPGVRGSGLARRPPGSPAAGSPAAEGSCPTAPPEALPAGETREVTIETDQGDIVIEVEADLGPLAAGNFVALAECGFYDGIVFHRILPGFVIQGGDPTGTGSGGPGYEFPNDPVAVPYERGVVAMANAGRDTNGSQFFIVLDEAGLPPDYSVFGRVTSGMEIADADRGGTGTGGQAGQARRPVDDEPRHRRQPDPHCSEEAQP